MKTKLLTRIPGMTLAVLLTLRVGQAPVFAHDDKLEGTWNDADCRVSTAERDERQPLEIKKGDGG